MLLRMRDLTTPQEVSNDRHHSHPLPIKGSSQYTTSTRLCGVVYSSWKMNGSGYMAPVTFFRSTSSNVFGQVSGKSVFAAALLSRPPQGHHCSLRKIYEKIPIWNQTISAHNV